MELMFAALAATVLASGVFAVTDGDGTKGNRLYRAGQYQEAVESFQESLAAAELSEDARTRAGLLNNMAASYYRLNQFDRARSSFVESLSGATGPDEVARAAYNAGNSSYRLGELEAAVGFYRHALMADPGSQPAKINFEFVRRKMAEQNQDQEDRQSGEKPEPSEYARALKAEADRMVAERRYRNALDLMMSGLQVDRTVSAYQEFIARTGSVADIDDPLAGAIDAP